MGPEEINPYTDDTRPKGNQVEEMFDHIAPAYDLMNRAMAFGIDKLWRRWAVKRVMRHGADRILDVATGTGDLAIRLARKVDPISVTGIDLSEGMLDRGRRKVADADLGDVVKLVKGDCLELPFPSDSFDAVTVAYGVRNFENILMGLKEMARVLKPGGMVMILELSTPKNRLVKWGYDLYSRHLIPAVGRLVSSDRRAYSYLPESIAAVPQGHDMCALMEKAGLSEAAYRSLTLGTCTIYTAIKPRP